MISKLLWALAVFIVLLIITMLWARTARRPTNLGLYEGQLAPCPDTPNCVSTQSKGKQQMEPLPYTLPVAEAQVHLSEIIQKMNFAEIVDNRPGYLAVEFQSRLFRFIDDVEFHFDDERKRVHFRSAARLGRSDMGVNRSRMMEISSAFLEREPNRGAKK